jgi:hypothetical protein
METTTPASASASAVQPERPEPFKVHCSVFNILLILMHYGTLGTDIWVLYEYYTHQEYSYFGVLVFFLGVSQLMGLYLILILNDNEAKLPKWERFIFWLFQLDFIYWLMLVPTKETKIDEGAHTLGGSIQYRKMGFNILQSTPSLFVTIYSLFHSRNTSFVAEISFFVSIFDITFTNVLYHYSTWVDGSVTMDNIDWKDCYMWRNVIPTFIYGLSENAMTIIFWAFATISKPWGVYVYFIISFLFLISFTCFYVRSRRDLWFPCFVACIWVTTGMTRIGYPLLRQDSPSENYNKMLIATVINRFILAVYCGILFLAYLPDLSDLLEETFWHGYFLSGCYFALAWAIMTIAHGLYVLLRHVYFKKYAAVHNSEKA